MVRALLWNCPALPRVQAGALLSLFPHSAASTAHFISLFHLRVPPLPLSQSSGYKKGGAAKAADKKKFELTEEQKQEIREAFDLFDTDGSGA